MKILFKLFIATTIVLAMPSLFHEKTLAQTDPLLSCSMPAGSQNSNAAIGGRWKPSSGIIRVLVVFIRFNGDNEVNTRWPDANVMPSWAARFVDTAYSASGNYTPGSMSHFFYENSYGAYHIIGDVYYVTTVNNEDYYHNLAGDASFKRRVLSDEVFNTLNNAPYNVDFRRYDNWKANGEFNFVYGQQDNILDMCWLITRNLHEDPLTSPYPPAQRFGIIWALLETSNPTYDGVTIRNGTEHLGSGLTYFGTGAMHSPLHASEAQFGEIHVVGTTAHEMSHYLFGYGHFGSYRASDGLEITTRRSNGEFRPYSANSGNCFGTFLGLEKIRLGWVEPTVINTNTDGVILHNFGTTTDPNQKRLIKIPIPNTSQYFLIENRQFISIFEPRNATFTPASGRLRPGILIYHVIQESGYFSSSYAQIRSADGRHVWKFLQGETTATHNDDLIDKDSANFAIGYDERERIYFSSKPSTEWWEAGWSNPEGIFFGYQKATNYVNATTVALDAAGDSLDVFQIGEVITPWSNPGSHYWTGSTFAQTAIGVEVVDYNSTTKAYTLNIRVSNAEQLAPSKPQNLRGSYAGNNQVNLTWTANIEPDISQYRIFRDGQLIQTVNHPTTSYTDVTTQTGSATYALKSVDTQGKESVFSESALVLLPPAAPQNLAITNAGQAGQSPNLSWNAVSGATSYKIYRGTIEGAPGTVNCSMVPVYSLVASTTSTSYVDGAVIIDPHSNILVCYYVTAVNQAGESGESNKVGVHGTAPLRMEDISRFLGQSMQMIPEEFSLSQNYPNPFNPETEISFALPEPSTVRLTVLDVLGREIVVLEDRLLPAGHRTARWNGRNAKGEPVGSGVYFYRITALGESGKTFSQTMKMLVAK